MKNINQKHVVLSMSNGCVLEGFVCEMKEKYLKLIENNNVEVIVKIEDISFARISGHSCINRNPENVFPSIEQNEVNNSLPNEDYSMPLPTIKDQIPYSRPEFLRSQK